MTAVEPHLEKFQHIDPQQVETYLVANGWQQQQKQADKASIWTLDGFEILLPLKPEIIDFKRRMAEVVETLALSENRSLSRNIRRLNYRGAKHHHSSSRHPHCHSQRRLFKWINHTPRYSCQQTTPYPY